jgi:hypothetical protein
VAPVLEPTAADALQMPFAHAELLARVRTLRRRGRPPATPSVIRDGLLEIDVTARSIASTRAVVALTDRVRLARVVEEPADREGARSGAAQSGAGEPRAADAAPTEVRSAGVSEGAAQSQATQALPGEPSLPTRGRVWLVRVLIWGTTVLALLAIFAVWANRELLNPNNWGNTSVQLLQNAAVRDATSNYLVNQLYANVDVAGALKSRLPTQLQPLAGPIAGALRNVATSTAQQALAAPRVQDIWKRANKAADQTFVNIVNGGKGALQVNGGEVSLNLAAIVAEITNRLGLPDLSSKLPPSVANLKIVKSNQIKLVQDGGKALKGLALLLTIIVPLLYALAIWLARGYRRRTLMNVGIAIVFAGVLVFLARTAIVSQVTDSLVKTDSVRPAAMAVLSIATSRLSEIAGAFVVVGVPLIAAAWFAGPARLPVRGRRAIAPFLRDRPGWTFGIVAAFMALIFIWQPIPATGTPAGIIVFLALAFLGTVLLRRQTVEEFPGA